MTLFSKEPQYFSKPIDGEAETADKYFRNILFGLNTIIQILGMKNSVPHPISLDPEKSADTFSTLEKVTEALEKESVKVQQFVSKIPENKWMSKVRKWNRPEMFLYQDFMRVIFNEIEMHGAIRSILRHHTGWSDEEMEKQRY